MATKAELESQLTDAHARIAQLAGKLKEARVMIAEREVRIESLETRFAKLEARLMTNSGNSHLSPSKNPLHAPKRGHKRGPTGKPPSGRNDHDPHFFAPIEPEAVMRHVSCEPATIAWRTSRTHR